MAQIVFMKVATRKITGTALTILMTSESFLTKQIVRSLPTAMTLMLKMP